jgi:hypothetical protein
MFSLVEKFIDILEKCISFIFRTKEEAKQAGELLQNYTASHPRRK